MTTHISAGGRARGEKPAAKRTDRYAAAGVDIAKGAALVKAIAPLTQQTARPGAAAALGGFGGVFDLKACGYTDPLLIAATDGVGTKLRLLGQTGKHTTAGIDLVAMCVNDLAAQGAEPLFFLDYFAAGRLEIETARQVVEGIAQACREVGCALIGGETAEMPGHYQGDDYDLAGFAVGAVERDALLPQTDAMRAGDVVLGVASSGPHSNGFSLIRQIIERAGADLDAPAPFDPAMRLADALLTPTRLYPAECRAAAAAGATGLAHITGGGLIENPPRVVPESLAVEIDLDTIALPPVFAWLRAVGELDTHDLLRSFNAGIGLTVIVPANKADAVMAALSAQNAPVRVIGRLVARDGGDAVRLTGRLV